MKPFETFGSFLFGLIAVAHLVRVIFGWSVSVEAVAIPVWPSAVIFVFVGALAILMWIEARPGTPSEA
jgi:hypothetical protein